MRKLWKVWSKLPIRPVQAVIPPLRTNCWELIRERDLCFMNLLWWLDQQKAVVYNNIFLSAPDISVLLVTLMITHRQGRSPDTELRLVPSFRDSGHRETEPPLAASVAAAGSRMVGSADGCGEFRSWLTLSSFISLCTDPCHFVCSVRLLSHCAMTWHYLRVIALCALHVTLVCISRLSASDWAEIVWRQRRGAGGWVPGLTRPTTGVNSGQQHHGRHPGNKEMIMGRKPDRINSIDNHFKSSLTVQTVHLASACIMTPCAVFGRGGDSPPCSSPRPEQRPRMGRAETEALSCPGTWRHHYRSSQSLWPGQDVKMTSMTWLSQSLRCSKTWNTLGRRSVLVSPTISRGEMLY